MQQSHLMYVPMAKFLDRKVHVYICKTQLYMFECACVHILCQCKGGDYIRRIVLNKLFSKEISSCCGIELQFSGDII